MLTWISPCVAPICGAYISQGVSWRWIFWVTSIFTVLVQVTALFFLKETFAPAILAKKAKLIRKALKGIRNDVVVRTEYETADRFSKILRKRLILPWVMMFTHPATQAPSIYRAYLYGVMYLMLSTFPLVFEEVYDMDVGPASLNYLSMCLGFMIGLQVSHPLMDGVSFLYRPSTPLLTSYSSMPASRHTTASKKDSPSFASRLCSSPASSVPSDSSSTAGPHKQAHIGSRQTSVASSSLLA